MSFRDEMKASLKTPQQVMSEKENAELHKIKTRYIHVWFPEI